MSLWVTINTGPYSSLQQQSEKCKVKSEQTDYRSYDLKWLEDPLKYRFPIFFLFSIRVSSVFGLLQRLLKPLYYDSLLAVHCSSGPDILYTIVHYSSVVQI